MDYLVKEAIIKSLQMGSTNNTHTERTVSGPMRVNGIEFLLSAFIFVKQTKKKKKSVRFHAPMKTLSEKNLLLIKK